MRIAGNLCRQKIKKSETNLVFHCYFQSGFTYQLTLAYVFQTKGTSLAGMENVFWIPGYIRLTAIGEDFKK